MQWQKIHNFLDLTIIILLSWVLFLSLSLSSCRSARSISFGNSLRAASMSEHMRLDSLCLRSIVFDFIPESLKIPESHQILHSPSAAPLGIWKPRQMSLITYTSRSIGRESSSTRADSTSSKSTSPTSLAHGIDPGWGRAVVVVVGLIVFNLVMLISIRLRRDSWI